MYKIKTEHLEEISLKLNVEYPHYKDINKELKLIKKWSKNNEVKCKVETISGYEYIVLEDHLEKIKTKSNKKTKK